MSPRALLLFCVCACFVLATYATDPAFRSVESCVKDGNLVVNFDERGLPNGDDVWLKLYSKVKAVWYCAYSDKREAPRDVEVEDNNRPKPTILEEELKVIRKFCPVKSDRSSEYQVCDEITAYVPYPERLRCPKYQYPKLGSVEYCNIWIHDLRYGNNWKARDVSETYFPTKI
jgi:hypothetical protein